MISFVIPYRDRPDQIDGCIYTINEKVSDYEIILCEQDNADLFLRGQLCNLGFKASEGDIVVFQDVDIRYLAEMPFQRWSSEYGRPYLPFDRITQLSEKGVGQYNTLHSRMRMRGFGACNVFTREQFERYHGFSNLILGWGGEDTLINTRVGGFKRIRGRALGHVAHPSNQTFKTRQHRRNTSMIKGDSKRDHSKDSFIQTTGRLSNTETIQESPKVVKLSYSHISVSDDFPYRKLLP